MKLKKKEELNKLSKCHLLEYIEELQDRLEDDRSMKKDINKMTKAELILLNQKLTTQLGSFLETHTSWIKFTGVFPSEPALLDSIEDLLTLPEVVSFLVENRLEWSWE